MLSSSLDRRLPRVLMTVAERFHLPTSTRSRHVHPHLKHLHTSMITIMASGSLSSLPSHVHDSCISLVYHVSWVSTQLFRGDLHQLLLLIPHLAFICVVLHMPRLVNHIIPSNHPCMRWCSYFLNPSTWSQFSSWSLLWNVLGSWLVIVLPPCISLVAVWSCAIDVHIICFSCM